ncbi:hypothetical protein BB559_000250 [Furculomyces boomerangus]|uniref:Sm protein E n=2 Tax=Harpellales TaxID=61421 RepID=A0A2T9Z5U1_9FUNG|nr:hypothetical protein BB559_000250 [Furculomyces boomerangus]PVZ97182.1 hypothetical protein BB558_006876 [Smittium angustum]
MSARIQKVLVQPIGLIFQFMQKKARVELWLFDKPDMRIEGRILGFDKFMNLVIDEAVEVFVKKGIRRDIVFYSISGLLGLLLFSIPLFLFLFQTFKYRSPLLYPILVYSLCYLLVSIGSLTKNNSLLTSGVKLNYCFYWLMMISFIIFLIKWEIIHQAIGNIKYLDNPLNKPPQVLVVAAVGFLSIASLNAIFSLIFGLRESLIYQTPKDKIIFLIPASLNVFRNLVFLLVILPFSTLNYNQYSIAQFSTMTIFESIIVLFWSVGFIGKKLVSDNSPGIVPIIPAIPTIPPKPTQENNTIPASLSNQSLSNQSLSYQTENPPLIHPFDSAYPVNNRPRPQENMPPIVNPNIQHPSPSHQSQLYQQPNLNQQNPPRFNQPQQNPPRFSQPQQNYPHYLNTENQQLNTPPNNFYRPPQTPNNYQTYRSQNQPTQFSTTNMNRNTFSSSGGYRENPQYHNRANQNRYTQGVNYNNQGFNPWQPNNNEFNQDFEQTENNFGQPSNPTNNNGPGPSTYVPNRNNTDSHQL